MLSAHLQRPRGSLGRLRCPCRSSSNDAEVTKATVVQGRRCFHSNSWKKSTLVKTSPA